MTDRKFQLKQLIDDLRQLFALIERDRDCPWTNAVRYFLSDAEHLYSKGFTQHELNDLAAAVMRIYGGMGSFNDYIPYEGDEIAAWAKQFDRLQGEVYDRALSLRVLENAS